MSKWLSKRCFSVPLMASRGQQCCVAAASTLHAQLLQLCCPCMQFFRYEQPVLFTAVQYLRGIIHHTSAMTQHAILFRGTMLLAWCFLMRMAVTKSSAAPGCNWQDLAG